jgi:hypothetical protein
MQRSIRPARRYPRIAADSIAYVRILGDRRKEKLVWVKVLAAGGCMLVSDDTIGFLSLMELRITLGNRELRADGRVAWESREGREHHVGVEFLRIGQSDRAAIQALVAASGAAA